MNVRDIASLQSYMFRVGSRSFDVNIVKTFLNHHSNVPVFDLANNGVFDAKTANAVAHFQRLNQLTPTGAMNLATWGKMGARMSRPQIEIISRRNANLGGLLAVEHIARKRKRRRATNKPAGKPTLRNKLLPTSEKGNDFNGYFYAIYVAAFAPFDWFGHFNSAQGDGANRRFSVDTNKTYRIRAETKMFAANDGKDFDWSNTIASDATTSTNYLFYEYSTKSPGYIRDPRTGEYLPGSYTQEGLAADYHLYGNDRAAMIDWDYNPVPDIDVHPGIHIDFDPQGSRDKVLMHVVGDVTGDQFPSVEAYITDRDGNGVMLGVFQPCKGDGPLTNLWLDKRLPMIDIDVTVVVENGVFKGVQKNGGVVSLKEHNSYYENLPTTKFCDKDLYEPRADF